MEEGSESDLIGDTYGGVGKKRCQAHLLIPVSIFH